MVETPLRVLLIEDDAADATLLRIALTRSAGNYEVKRASCLKQGVRLARETAFPIILTDMGLPDSVGLESVEHLCLASRDSAIIVLSGSEDEQLYIDALSSGADNFLCKKDLTPQTVHRCIQQSVERLKQRYEIRHLIRHVQEQKGTLEQQAVQLSQKNQRLEQLCDSSQKFVNNVSHEFRTPLCVVKQYASLIADGVVGDVTEEQCRMLRVIEGRVDDLNNMVDDMLDISRHESGLLSASRESHETEDIINRILPSLQQRALLRGIKIETEIESELRSIYCDAEKVSRTLINLIVNAIKFSANGDTVTIAVSQCRINREVTIAVQDTGPGIEPAQCEQIFARFKQANTNLQGSTKGFGLGLNIAKELVDLNLGSMSLQSVVGSGSRFSFTVPFDDAAEIASRYLARLQSTFANQTTKVEVLSIQLDTPEKTKSEIQDIQNFLNYLVRSHDLILRVDAGHWIVMLDADPSDAEMFLSRLDEETRSINRNRPQGPLPGIQVIRRGGFELPNDLQKLKNIKSLVEGRNAMSPPKSFQLNRGQHV